MTETQTPAVQYQGYCVWGTATIEGRKYFAQFSKSMPTLKEAKQCLAQMTDPPSDAVIHGHTSEGL